MLQQIQIIVTDPVKEASSRLRLRCRIADNTSYNEHLQGKNLLLYLPPSMPQPQIGECYQLSSPCIIPTLRQKNPSFKRYLLSQNIHGVIYVNAKEALSPLREKASVRWIEYLKLKANLLRTHLLASLSQLQGITSEEAAMIGAMTLGKKEGLHEKEEEFRSVGVAHLLSVSGLHVGIIYAFLMLLLRPLVTLCKKQWPLRLILLTSIWGFAFLSGLSIPTLRATLFASVILLARIAQREVQPVHTLFLVALILLLHNPFTLFDVGFQLSFVSVLSILWFAPLFEYLLPDRLYNPILHLLWNSIRICLAVYILLWPLLLWHFGHMALLPLLTNIPLGLLASLLLPLSLVYMFTITFIGDSLILSTLIEKLTTLFSQTLHFSSTYYGIQLNSNLSPSLLILYYLSLWIMYSSIQAWRHRQKAFQNG